ncbi:MAG: ATP-binding protein [Lachnospiraceae bacterium]|nr:ATP-binding protein [Lachnospiraceae bacterium]
MIYCVEDEDSIRELMLYTLNMAGFEAVGFSESRTFWDAMESGHPDLIMLDIMLPGEDGMKRENVDLFQIAQNAVDSVLASAEKQQIALTLSGEKASYYGIPQVLYSIVYNLCDNAIKYNRENGTVDVAVMNTTESVVVTVSDTGIGIPKEYQDRIFERFYRVDKSHSREIGGTGLGLSIVKHGALIHNAEIRVESTPDMGTTFTVTFPKPDENQN